MRNPAGIQAFAHRLRQLRAARGYSQQKLADIANVEQSTIKRIELVQLAPTLDLLISLSRALDLAVRDLLDDPAITHAEPVPQLGTQAVGKESGGGYCPKPKI